MGRIGIYGGTYNPPHMGHVLAAKQAVKLMKLDKLLLIPTNVPPHKTLPENSPTAEQRLNLVRLAAKEIPGGEVSDIEIFRRGTSYTADTICQLHEQYPNDQLYLIMGTDMFTCFHKWYQPDRICKYATLAVLMREEKDTGIRQQLDLCARQIREELGGQVEFVENDIFPMSSTDVRRMLAFRAAEGMVPQGVFDEIQKLGCYGVHEQLSGLSEKALEQKVCSLLNPKRVSHVLGCRDTAVQLAQQYGADTTDAARAALLHDVTKALPEELHRKLLSAYEVPPERYAEESPRTLHAITGAVVAEYVFKESPNVCRAIASHTTGCSHMDTLQKIIYIADYMEPNRDFPGVERLRELVQKDLDQAVLLGLNMTMEQLRQQGRQISQNSMNAIGWLERQSKAQ